MIESLSGWVGRLVLLLVAAGVVDLALPQGSLRRYVEVVVGLVVLATILGPLLGWLGADLDEALAEAMMTYERAVGEVAAGASRDAQGRAAAGMAWHQRAVTEAATRRVAAAVRDGLARELGMAGNVEVQMAAAAAAGEPPTVERVVVRLVGGAADPEETPGTGEAREPEGTGVAPVRVEVSPVRAVAVQAPGAAAGAAEAVSEETARRLRRWVAEALGIDPARVEVLPAEEVER